MDESVYTGNRFGVGMVVGSGDITIMMPPSRMSPENALILAAYLVALADPMQERFKEVLNAILNT